MVFRVAVLFSYIDGYKILEDCVASIFMDSNN